MTRCVLCATTLLIASMSVATRAAETFGTTPTLSEATPIAQLVAKPADFEGRTVRVEGVVTAVCTMMGCWMALAPTDAPKGPALLVKVDDGVIVFPISARGKRATAQGVLERVGTGDAEGQEAAREHAQHEGRAKTAGATRPPSPSGSGAATAWQIKATGAIVY